MGRGLVVPTLTTARLTLERLGRDHSRGMFELWSQEAVCRHSGPAFDVVGDPIQLPARSADDSDRIIHFFEHGAAQGERFRWAMLERSSGRFVGAIGFNHLGPVSEIAYHLHPDAWGRGLMGEAAAAALAWLRARPEAHTVEAFIDPANTASARLAQRLGLRPTGETSEGADRYLRALGA